MLSLCIPTYNRSRYLAELLDSILEQGDSSIEIIISDDASTDDTEQVVESYMLHLPGIRYVKHMSNMGLDRNFLFIVEQASGDYAWLLGDDDRLEPNALQTVTSQLKGWPEACGMTLGVINYDHDMKYPTGVGEMPDTALLRGAEDVFGMTIASLACMSATIVNRRLWLQACQNNPIMEYTNLYIQVYIIGCMIGKAGTWGVLNTPCIGFRGDNDQFLSKVGWLRRLEIDVFSYNQIFNGVFTGRPGTIKALNEHILKTHVAARVYNGKSKNVSYKEFLKAFAVLTKYYSNISFLWKVIVPILIMPSWMVRVLRSLYQNYSPNSGTQRAKVLLGNG